MDLPEPESQLILCVSAGLPSPLHIPGGPPQFSSMEEMGVGSSRAKRYSSQRQRAVPEPAPPMHLGVMDGHYYEPSKRKKTFIRLCEEFKKKVS